MVPYKTMSELLSDNINKSQYFNPFFSWVVVVYTYYSIGINGGLIWKYLFYNATVGFIAICISMTYSMAENLNYKYELFIKLIWIEEFLWNVNEWGYVFINFIKIRSCIKSLKKGFWMCIVLILFFYTLIIRSFLCYYDYNYKLNKYKNGGKLSNDQEQDYSHYSNMCNGFLYFPLGIICFVFIYLIFVEFINEDDKNAKNILSILLHSTLSRMLLVSLIFLGMSLIVHFSKTGIPGVIRRFLWRMKGSLGIIFLIDILLLRIDLDQNQISLQLEELEKKSIGKSLKHTSYDVSYKNSIPNHSDLDYATLLLSNNADEIVSPENVTFNNNDKNNNNNNTNEISFLYENNNSIFGYQYNLPYNNSNSFFNNKDGTTYNSNNQNLYEFNNNNIFNYQHGLPYINNRNTTTSPSIPPSITVSLSNTKTKNSYGHKKYPSSISNIVLENKY
ncbi:hypothetical protein BCR36DRAFT_412327 [Piromyces finnis]|uniref:Uncharacterized protein n=1 Tax=Piromyces finnis TaxID=1754191 RepID=A0A1Y1V9C1_9FUNG|nr:hypothetical protein BCR36DRAFT_412327 [Piromyces finnis]|eukprot:ORX50300.1 hypothetical protein BCR36DRAFT_412327 [Piromyces finnis]